MLCGAAVATVGSSLTPTQCAHVQTPLARHLLQILPEYQEELEGAAPHAGMPMAKLVLSQFRWLEHVADGSGTPPPCVHRKGAPARAASRFRGKLFLDVFPRARRAPSRRARVSTP